MSLSALFDPIRGFLNRITELVVDFLDLLLNPLQKRIGVKGMAYVFILPNLLIFGIFILFPMILNVQYSLTGGDELFLSDRQGVGFANYEELFDCENFFEPNTCDEDFFARAVVNTALFVIAQVVLMIVISTITALALNGNVRFRGFFRSVFFYPVLLSPIVVALIWKWILQDNGVLNALILSTGGEKQPWLLDANWARFWVVMISVWAYMGFYTLILLAGLQSIPGDLYEAASIDGANRWDSFWRITLPLLAPTMLVVIVLSLIRAVQVFDVVFAFTGGGPGTSTLYLVQYIYRTGFSGEAVDRGLASAASMVMALFLVIATLVQLRLRRNSGGGLF